MHIASIVKTMAKECPEVDPQAPLPELYGSDLYCSFTKVNAAIGHAKQTVTTDGKDVECQVAGHDISISTQGFLGRLLAGQVSSGLWFTSCTGSARMS